MKVELTCEGPSPEGEVRMRVAVINDSYEPAPVDRRLLFGPHPASGDPPMLSSEPSFATEDENTVVLNPWSLYGRERRFQYDKGEVTFHGFLLRHPTDSLRPTGPMDEEALEASAAPLTVRFGDTAG